MIRIVFGAHSASCCCGHCSILLCLARGTGADDLSSQSFAFHQNSCRCSSVLLLLLLLTNIILQCTNGRDNRQTCMWIIQFWRRRVSQSLDLCDSYSPELPLFSDWQLDRHTMSSVLMKSPQTTHHPCREWHVHLRGTSKVGVNVSQSIFQDCLTQRQSN